MIFVRIWEGLGNQLFQYAYARAFSLKTSQKVFLDVRETGKLSTDLGRVFRKYSLENFNIKLPVCTNIERFYPQLSEKKGILFNAYKIAMRYLFSFQYYEESVVSYHEELLDLKGNWYLQGWFQNIQYFEEYENVIRKELTPKKKIKITKELKDILQKKETVSVHIRRGDYQKTDSILPLTYYKNAMIRMQTLLEAPFWIVFSDDLEWCKENMDFGNQVYYIGEKEHLQDFEELLVMSRCKNHIIANSTFSWWGAWLNRRKEKIVIGPNKWFIRGNRDNGVNIMPQEWIHENILSNDANCD